MAAVIDRLQEAFVAGDYEAICAGAAPTAIRQAGMAAHGEVTQCVRDVRRLFVMVQKIDRWRHPAMPRVIDVEVEGSEAVATVALDRRWRARVPMIRQDGRWRLSGMFATPKRDALEVARSIPQTDFPTGGRVGVRAVDGAGVACPDLSEERYPRLSGGCRIRLESGMMPLTVLTAFGDFRFGRCTIDYRVSVDAEGRTWTEDFQVGGVGGSPGCGDVNACDGSARANLQFVPWRGRLYPSEDGSYVHRMDMCLGTCVGYFVGQLVVRLVPDGDGWRAEPVDGGGDTGFRFDAPFRVKTDVELTAS